jgi:hypothetical protein
MKLFLVMVEGRNCVMLRPVVGGSGNHVSSRSSTERLGFFASRLVEARDRKAAGALAIQVVEDELRSRQSLRNGIFDPPKFTVSEIRELGSGDTVGATRAGFTFFPEDPPH